jgi:hypothetical protein
VLDPCPADNTDTVRLGPISIAGCQHQLTAVTWAGCALWKRRRSAGPAQSAYHRAAQVDKAGGVAVGAASGVQGDGLAAQGTQSAPVGVDLHIAFPR